MPIFEYDCVECGKVNTELRKIADRSDDGVCSECEGTTKFKISTPNFTGSGDGWYGSDRPTKISSKNLESGDY